MADVGVTGFIDVFLVVVIARQTGEPAAPMAAAGG
jgi:hypothetical protein